MYTVYDFVNMDIEPKKMRFGWKVETHHGIGLSASTEIAVKYTMLNFDWSSLDYIGNDLWNMFLKSESYKRMKAHIDRAMLRYKRLYFAAYSIEDLKVFVEDSKLKMNIDKLIDAAVKKKSEKAKMRIEKLSEIEEREKENGFLSSIM